MSKPKLNQRRVESRNDMRAESNHDRWYFRADYNQSVVPTYNHQEEAKRIKAFKQKQQDERER